MSKEKRLIKNTIIFTIGNFSTKMLSFLLLPFYTYYLSTADYGFVDLVSTTISFFIPIITFQLMDGCYRYLITQEKEEEKKKVISSAVYIVLRNLLIANILFVILNIFIKLNYSVLIFLQFNLAIMASFLQQAIRGLKKNHIYTMAGIISTFCMLLSNIFLIVVVGLKAEGLIISTIVSYVVIAFYITIATKFYRYIDLRKKDVSLMKELKKYSIPLIPNYLNWWIMNVSDRLVINLFLGMSSNGIYAIANKFPQAFQMLTKMFNMAWQESAITEYDSKERDAFYSSIFNNYSTILLTSLIVMLSMGRILFKVGINEKFSEAYYYVPFLFYGVIFSTFSSFYGTGYQSSKNTKGAFSSSVLGSILNILINIILIPYIGLYAASVSTMLSFALMWIYRIFDTRKYIKIKIKWNKFIILFAISILYVVIYYIKISFIEQIISIVIAGGIFIIGNKNIFTTVLRKILRKRSKR